MRALVIDDSRAMRSILGRILRRAGFEVAEAGNGWEGLEQLQGGPPIDIALVDWHMPEMDGCQFVRSVRALDQYRGLPVLMITSETEAGQIAVALEAGANEYVMKPFTPELLLGKLELLGFAGPEHDA